MSIDAGADNTLSPGETVDAHLVLGLTKAKKFSLTAGLSVCLWARPSIRLPSVFGPANQKTGREECFSY